MESRRNFFTATSSLCVTGPGGRAHILCLGGGHISSMVLGVVKISLLVEVSAAVLLTARFWLGYSQPPAEALWLFHAVSASKQRRIRPVF